MAQGGKLCKCDALRLNPSSTKKKKKKKSQPQRDVHPFGFTILGRDW
jgi:hypothetical protein